MKKVFYFMGRKYTNESEDVYDNQTIKWTISQVKLPTYKKVTYKVKISENLDGKPMYGTTDFITNQPPPKDIQVVKTEDVRLPLWNLCPNCSTLGRPRIDKKNNTDRRLHSSKGRKRHSIIRQDEYRLIYNHKIDGKIKPCIVARFDKNHGIFTKNGKLCTEIRKLVFPYFIQPMKNI